MDFFQQDLRYALRSLRKTPLLSLAALACIAIGVGATVSVFTLINSTLIGGLPYPQADRLVRVWGTAGADDPRRNLSYLNYRDLAEVSSLESLEGAARTRLSMVDDIGVERIRGESVTPGYFELIGVTPAHGRTFGRDEYVAGSADLILIGYDLWQRRFGGDPDVVDRTLEARGSWGGDGVSNRPYRILGVMPEGFAGTIEEDESEFWLPISHFEPRANLERREQRVMWTIGRLAEGATVESANQEATSLGAALEERFPEANHGFGARAEPLGENWREDLRGGLYLLLAASFLLLLIACTNIANLLLARLARRRHELMVRLVMGARRGRVLRQLLTESLVLATLGGALGIGLAWLFVHAYLELAGDGVPAYVDLALDWRVALLSLGVVVATGVLFGVVPAWLGSRTDTSADLKEGGRGSSASRRQKRFGEVLIAAEVALTLILLLAASLMFRSYQNLETEDLGYDISNLGKLSTTLDLTAYGTPESWGQARRDAKEAIAAYPGVVAVASAGGVLPPVREAEVAITFPALAGGELEGVNRHLVDEDFFTVLDVDLLHGRAFTAADRTDAPRVTVVSESIARQVGDGDPQTAVGQQVQFVIARNPPQTSQPYEIVGVAGDMLYDGPVSERPHDYDLFLSVEQVADYLVSFAVRTAGPPENLLEPLTRVVAQEVSPSPVHWVRVVRETIAERYSDTRFYTLLIVVYSLSAVILAIIGIYGVLANSVSRRRRELGIRVAIGAQGAQLLRMVVAQSMRTVAIGILVGLIVAFVGMQILESLLYAITATDPWTFGMAVAALLLLALLAAYLPARRATRIDPVVALRHE